MKQYNQYLWHRITLSLLLLAPLLNGCSTLKNIAPDLLGAVPASDPRDPCNGEVQDFKRYEKKLQPLFSTEEIQSFIKKGFKALFSRGVNREQQLDDLFNQIADTALDNATKAYLSRVGDRASNRNAVLNNINNDAASDSFTLQQMNEQVIALRACRERQIEIIAARNQRGELADEQATADLQEAQEMIERDNQFINSLASLSSDRIDTYIKAYDYIDTGEVTTIDRANASSGEGKYVQQTVSIYSQPHKKSRTLGKLAAGSRAQITGTSGEWYEITFNGGSGYVLASLIDSKKNPDKSHKKPKPRPTNISVSRSKSVQKAAVAQQNLEVENKQSYASLSQQVQDKKQGLGRGRSKEKGPKEKAIG